MGSGETRQRETCRIKVGSKILWFMDYIELSSGISSIYLFNLNLHLVYVGESALIYKESIQLF